MKINTPDELGYYGQFGGAYIPEMLFSNVEELRTSYLDIINDGSFREEFNDLLRNFAGRPTPLLHAKALSRQFKTNVYLKREDLCHTGSHNINNAIGQLLVAGRLGRKRIIADTGSGLHGVAVASVCALKGFYCKVFMGAKDIERQAPNVELMKMYGATVVPVTTGNGTMKDATNEALRNWIKNAKDSFYVASSVTGPHPYPDMVARFQSIISEEIRDQLKRSTGQHKPDYVIACVGGGSNAAGAFYHYLDESSVRLIAVEAAGQGLDSGMSAATTQLGKVGIFQGSKSLVMQTAEGQVQSPHSISAGLNYPGIGPMHAQLFLSGRVNFISITDEEAVAAGLDLARKEGILPAIESAHALAVLGKLSFATKQHVVLCLSGRGDKDMTTYSKYLK